MSRYPLVSIIVPNYNHARFLRERLDSIYHQTYPNKEVILLDDRSTDDSVDVMQSYAGRPETKCLLRNEQNSGSAFVQWARGIEEADEAVRRRTPQQISEISRIFLFTP